MAGRLSAVVLAGWLLTSLGGCESGGAPSGARAGSNPQPPRAFSNVYTARIAGDKESLWLLQAGRANSRSAELSLRVFRRRKDGHWRGIPSPPGRTVDGVPIGFELNERDQPCVSSSNRQAASVRCFIGERWQRVFERSAKPEAYFVQQLVRVGDQLLMLTSRPAQKGARTYEVQFARRGGTKVLTRMTFRGFAALGTRDGGTPTLTTQSFESSGVVRRTYRLESGRWRSDGAAIQKFRAGPQISGPVWTGSKRVEAVNEGSGEAWPFSVLVGTGDEWTSVGGKPLNRTDGRAQGLVFGVAGRAWAIWQEHALRHDGSFDAEIYAGVVNATPDLVGLRRIWAGQSIGPGDLGIAQAYGDIWALIMRPSSGSTDALQPHIVRLSPG